MKGGSQIAAAHLFCRQSCRKRSRRNQSRMVGCESLAGISVIRRQRHKLHPRGIDAGRLQRGGIDRNWRPRSSARPARREAASMTGPDGGERFRRSRANPAEISGAERQSHRDGDRPAKFGRRTFRSGGQERHRCRHWPRLRRGTRPARCRPDRTRQRFRFRSSARPCRCDSATAAWTMSRNSFRRKIAS